MAINEAETSRAPVLLKESAIPEASLAGRKPADLGKAILLFCRSFKRYHESTTRKTTVCLHRMILCQRNNKLLFCAHNTDSNIQSLIFFRHSLLSMTCMLSCCYTLQNKKMFSSLHWFASSEV